MVKKYTSPAIKVLSFEKTEDVIQTSGLEMEGMPKYTINGESMENYGTNAFSIFKNN